MKDENGYKVKGELYVMKFDDGGRSDGWNGIEGDLMSEIWDGYESG